MDYNSLFTNTSEYYYCTALAGYIYNWTAYLFNIQAFMCASHATTCTVLIMLCQGPKSSSHGCQYTFTKQHKYFSIVCLYGV